MNSSQRKKIYISLGLLGGLAVWPLIEILLLLQNIFSDYLVFSLSIGAVFGIVMGAFFASSEGIFLQSKQRLIRGILRGILYGLAGGMIAALIAQFLLFSFGEYLSYSFTDFHLLVLPLSRALGWSALGAFIGIIDGVRIRSREKILHGAIGGFIGGLVGGLILEYIFLLFSSIPIARLLGLLIYGLLLGYAYHLVEERFAFGSLIILNGKMRGQEILIDQKSMTIGRNPNNDIVLHSYLNIADNHAYLELKNDNIFLNALHDKNKVFVNEQKISSWELKIDDIIRIGTAKLYFKIR